LGLAAAGTAVACAPDQFFANFMNTPDQMHISWTTTCDSDATVQYGMIYSSLITIATKTLKTLILICFSVVLSANCGISAGTTLSLGSSAPANSSQYSFGGYYGSPYIHHAILSGLPLATEIFYKVGGSTSGFSGVMNITTHPGVGAQVPYLFAVMGDLGQSANSVDTLAHITANPLIQAIMYVGDLSYADAEGDHSRWDSWQSLVGPVAAHLPFMTSVGNHEIEVGIVNIHESSARSIVLYILS
jgi:hypothetical protein